MSEDNVFRIAVISDMHVGSNKDDNNETWLRVDTPDDISHPIFTLKQLINSENIQVNILLNCGDMTIKADFASQKYAWKQSKSIASLLGATLIGTVGNHDIDSRCQNSTYDVKSGLQKLDPPFPGIDEDYSNKYWAKNFVISEMDGIRILNINSCAYHGYCGDSEEHKFGRISQLTIDKIKSELESDTKTYKLNLCFFHHHIGTSNCHDIDDYSNMINGDKLMEVLSGAKDSNWLIVHGHQHCPHIKYKRTIKKAKEHVIFAAGSFASKRPFTADNKQQFYVIEIEDNDVLPVYGKIKAWTYHFREGWKKSLGEESITYDSGFGYSIDLDIVKNKIIEYLEKIGSHCDWKDLENEIDGLEFISNSHLTELLNMLEEECEITNIKSTNKITQIMLKEGKYAG